MFWFHLIRLQILQNLISYQRVKYYTSTIQIILFSAQIFNQQFTSDWKYFYSGSAKLYFDTQQHMDNNFKNPFEIDEQHLEMISLEATKNQTQSISSQQTLFVAAEKQTFSTQSNNIDVSQQSMFDLINNNKTQTKQPTELDQNDDPPLLQDIGIDIELIKKRLVAILTFQDASQQLIASPDLFGPILISFTLGFLLLLSGKMHFSDIQTAFIIGTILLYYLLNCMNKGVEVVPLYNVMSFLGYSLLPMLFLAFVGIFVNLNGIAGVVCGCVLAGWSAFSGSGLLSVMLNLQSQKMLIAYPLFLFYVSFALVIIF